MHTTDSFTSNSPSTSSDLGGGLHFAFQSEILLFPKLQLSSWPAFIFGCLLTSSFCFLERFITYLLTSHTIQPPKKRVAVYRTALYAIATTLRLAYMLLSMTLNAGIIAVIIASLAIGQFYIELQGTSSTPSNHSGGSKGSGGSNYQSIPTPDFEDDLEATGGPWDGNREARDKARQIMLGSTRPPTSTSGPFSAQVHSQQFDTRRGGSQQRFIPLQKRDSAVRFSDLSGSGSASFHRRQQSSIASTGTAGTYRVAGSSGSLPRGGSFMLGSGRSTPTNGPRKALFQIGSGDEGHTTTDSDD